MKNTVSNKNSTLSGRKVVRKSREFANKRASSTLRVSKKPKMSINFLHFIKKNKNKLVILYFI